VTVRRSEPDERPADEWAPGEGEARWWWTATGVVAAVLLVSWPLLVLVDAAYRDATADPTRPLGAVLSGAFALVPFVAAALAVRSGRRRAESAAAFVRWISVLLAATGAAMLFVILLLSAP